MSILQLAERWQQYVSRPKDDANRRASSKRRDIQGLRAFAVIVVILSHLFEWPSGGFAGVDVFFVISGFLITGLLVREWERTETISFRGFYVRRIKRILPAALVVLVFTTVAAAVVMPHSGAHAVRLDALAALVFVANWRFLAVGSDYFQQGQPPSPLQHYWSLSVEEQFYFVWPWLMLGLLVLLATLRVHERWDRRAAAIAMAVILGLSFIYALYASRHEPTGAYFSSLTRAWELGAGAVVACLAPILSRISATWRPLLAWLGICGLIASMFVISSTSTWPAPTAALPVLSTVLVIAAGTGAEARFMWPLTNPVSGFVGDLSYSLYLWHFPLVVLAGYVADESTLRDISVLALTALLSTASYYGIERPIHTSPLMTSGTVKFERRGAWHHWWDDARETALLGLLGLLAICAALMTFQALQTSKVAAADASDDVAVRSSSIDRSCLGAAALDASKSESCSGKDLGPLAPAVDHLQDDAGAIFTRCFRGQGQPSRSCTIGSTEAGAKKVAIIGDSHGAMYLPALNELGKKLHWKVTTYTGYDCQWKPQGNGDCAKMVNHANDDFLHASKKYDVVITTATRKVSKLWTDGRIEAIASQWRGVAERGTKIVVLQDDPVVAQSQLLCVQRTTFNPATDDCAQPISDAMKQPDRLAQVVPKVPGASYVKTAGLFCRANDCPMVIGNELVYRDGGSHITATYMRSMVPYLADRLKGVFADS